jgi:hypothetical protein
MGMITDFLKKVSGVQAYQDRKKAISAKEEADALLESLNKENERKRQESNEILADFGKTRLEALKSTVGVFLKYIEVLGHNYKEKEYEILGKIDIKPEQIKELESVEMNASNALGTVAASGSLAAAALTGVPSAVTWGVGAFATASTGTAISSLSGAAATNATLAWLGGGSIAAGGGGMAAGATVLAGITYASMGVLALASAGLISSAYYSKKYTEATQYLESVKEYRSKLHLGWELMNRINQRARELKSITLELQGRIENSLLYLEPLIYDFQNTDEYYLQTFQECAIMVKAMSELSQTPIMDEQGNLSNASNVIVSKTQKILNQNL